MFRKMILVVSIVTGVVVASSIGYMLVKRFRSRMREIQSIDELREQFNEDQGKPRLVLLLSPT